MAGDLETITEKLKKTGKILEEHTEIMEKHTKVHEHRSRMLEEHSKVLVRLEASVNSLMGRLGVDLERAILNIYRDVLEKMGVEVGRVEKISYKDIDGRYYRKGARLELDIYTR